MNKRKDEQIAERLGELEKQYKKLLSLQKAILGDIDVDMDGNVVTNRILLEQKIGQIYTTTSIDLLSTDCCKS